MSIDVPLGTFVDIVFKYTSDDIVWPPPILACDQSYN